LLVEAVRDRALADDRQLGVDVDRARPGHEEEARLEVLQVVDRERIQALAVDREHPAREEARVEREETRRVGERRLHVAVRVADADRVAIEDFAEPVAHAVLLLVRCLPGKSRCTRTSSRQSPSTARSPRSTAATAFFFPVASWSKSALSARTTQSADAFRRDTESAALSIVTNQRSVFPRSTMSKRTMHFAFPSSGSRPRAASASKNDAVGSVGLSRAALPTTGDSVTERRRRERLSRAFRRSASRAADTRAPTPSRRR